MLPSSNCWIISAGSTPNFLIHFEILSNLYLIDISGKIVKNMSVNLQKGNNTINIEKQGNLAPGAYILNLKNDEINSSIRLFKVNY